MYCMA